MVQIQRREGGWRRGFREGRHSRRRTMTRILERRIALKELRCALVA